MGKSANFMAASVLATGLAHGVDWGTAPATSARRSHRPTGRELAEKRLAAKREANKAIPQPEGEPSRQVKRGIRRAAAKRDLAFMKKSAMRERLKGGSATLTRLEASEPGE